MCRRGGLHVGILNILICSTPKQLSLNCIKSVHKFKKKPKVSMTFCIWTVVPVTPTYRGNWDNKKNKFKNVCLYLSIENKTKLYYRFLTQMQNSLIHLWNMRIPTSFFVSLKFLRKVSHLPKFPIFSFYSYLRNVISTI